jgi:drug/metabolite transporter (DMT)-like permease
MNERLTLGQIGLLFAYASGMAGGQLLFKMAALRFAADASFAGRWLGLFQNGFFLAAVVLYSALAILWVWILSFTPLSRGYPFVAIAFALTPVLGGIVFAEPISVRLVLGIIVIACGLVLVAG